MESAQSLKGTLNLKEEKTIVKVQFTPLTHPKVVAPDFETAATCAPREDA
jgi:hypothetical protein